MSTIPTQNQELLGLEERADQGNLETLEAQGGKWVGISQVQQDIHNWFGKFQSCTGHGTREDRQVQGLADQC
jgi:hypothetical protein